MQKLKADNFNTPMIGKGTFFYLFTEFKFALQVNERM